LKYVIISKDLGVKYGFLRQISKDFKREWLEKV
jgi:hypothetical protein